MVFLYSSGILYAFFSVALFSQYLRNVEASHFFDEPIVFVNTFIKNNSRLPTQSELSETNFNNKKSFNISQSVTNSENSSTDSKHYTLSLWRGEWADYYYSESNTNTCLEFSLFSVILIIVLPLSGILSSVYYIHQPQSS